MGKRIENRHKAIEKEAKSKSDVFASMRGIKMDIRGVSIGDTVYKIDFEYLANKPESDLPEVTAADEGKFLRVTSAGEWAAETLTAAEGVSF